MRSARTSDDLGRGGGQRARGVDLLGGLVLQRDAPEAREAKVDERHTEFLVVLWAAARGLARHGPRRLAQGHDVVQLQVAVHDLVVVEVRHRAQQLLGARRDARLADAAAELREHGPLAELHDQDQAFVLPERLAQVHNVRVVHPAQHVDFVAELLEPRGRDLGLAPLRLWPKRDVPRRTSGGAPAHPS
jgi:hypothetical protein